MESNLEQNGLETRHFIAYRLETKFKFVKITLTKTHKKKTFFLLMFYLFLDALVYVLATILQMKDAAVRGNMLKGEVSGSDVLWLKENFLILQPISETVFPL